MLTANVTSTISGTITGSVTFKDGSTTVGEAIVSGGLATLTTSTLAVGSHSLTATYNGDSNYGASMSSALTQNVNAGEWASFSATATSTSSVAVWWVAGAGAAQIEIYRSQSNSGFSLIATVDADATPYIDGGLTPGKTYLYRARWLDSGLNPSSFTPIDPATTILFTNDPIMAGVTIAIPAHIMELRTAANAIRAAVGLSPIMFTDDPLAAGTFIRAVHILEIRNAIAPARSAIGLDTIGFTDPTITVGETVVKAAHVQELRNSVK